MGLRENLVAVGLSVPEEFGADLERWAGKLAESPCRNTASVVGLSTVLFYLLEKNRNPKVNDVWDAMVYCSTCLSVGYGDIFARTPLGKILGSALMTMGPAMAAKTLEGEAEEKRDAVQEELLEAMRKILTKIEGRAG
jgi:hypothetical protein